MSDNRNLINHVLNKDVVSFRRDFAATVNNVMANKISFDASHATSEPAATNESVLEEGKKKLSDDEKALAKKAFEDGAKAASKDEKPETEEEEDEDNSDLYIFQSSEEGLAKAKEIVTNYNKSHANNKLEVRVFAGDKMTRFFVNGDDVGRKQVKNLLKGVGGKLQS